MLTIAKLYNFIHRILEKSMRLYWRKKMLLQDEVELNSPLSTFFKGRVLIGIGTYINSGRFLAGESSKIVIGKNCAIGHNVTMSAITHDLRLPTGPGRLHKEGDIIIGDDVWIGTNVFIKEGIILGNKVVVGSNSVVTKSFSDNSIIAGVPARLLRVNTDNANE